MSIYTQKFSTPLQGSPKGRFAKVLFTAKDVFAVKGYPVSAGLEPPYCSHSETSATIIDDLLFEGATLVGLTNLDPLAGDMQGKNPFFGDATNPLFPDEPMYGSSFGSALSCLEQGIDFSLCTDSGGSARAPAASVNIFGFKATSGLFPRGGVLLHHPTFDCIGVMSASLSKIRSVVEFYAEGEISRGVQIVHAPKTELLEGLDRKIHEAFLFTVEKLKGHYEVLFDLEASLFQEATDLRKIPLSAAIAASAEDRKITIDSLKAMKAFAASLSKSDLQKNDAAVCRFKGEVEQRFHDSDIIITPTLWLTSHTSQTKFPVNLFLTISNLCDLPSISLPIPDNFPWGVNITFCNQSNLSAIEQTSLILQALSC